MKYKLIVWPCHLDDSTHFTTPKNAVMTPEVGTEGGWVTACDTVAQMWWRWCALRENGSMPCYSGVKALWGPLNAAVTWHLEELCCFCSDQVFRITPGDDEEVQVLKKILAHMKVCTYLFLLYFRHTQMYSAVLYVLCVPSLEILSHNIFEWFDFSIFWI